MSANEGSHESNHEKNHLDPHNPLTPFRMLNRWYRSFTLPNRLTLLRFALVPVFLVLLAIPGTRVIPAFILFVMACVTDWLDGFLARKFKQQTGAGALLDPIADKLFVIPPLIYFTAAGEISAWYVIIIVSRELIINVFRLVGMVSGNVVPANKLGKVKTVAQLALLGSLTLRMRALSAVLAPIAVVLTVVSLIEYFAANRDILRDLK